jgi:c(7)-type cytochrome triheme protein
MTLPSCASPVRGPQRIDAKEGCHPQIFGVASSANQYTMQEIFDGFYCGACHGKVSFSNDDCMRCHPGMRANK